MRMFNSQSSNNRGYNSNNNPRALLGSGQTYWSDANRNDQSPGSSRHQRTDLNGVGSSSSGSGRSAKTMTWASVASQPSVKPIKTHSLRSKMANSSGSSLTPFSSSGGKSLPPPIVTAPISSVPPPVLQQPISVHPPPSIPTASKTRDAGLSQPSLFASHPSAHHLLASKNSGQNQNDENRPNYSNRSDNRFNCEYGGNSSMTDRPSFTDQPGTPWQQPHHRNFPGNQNQPPSESITQRPLERPVRENLHGNGNGIVQQEIASKYETRTLMGSKLSSSSPSSNGTSSSRSLSSSLTSDRTDRESSESSSVTAESVSKSLTALKLEPVVKVDKIDEILHQFNPDKFDLSPINARFFVIKSYSEDDIHRSIKYSIWCSTDHGNKRLDIAYKAQQSTNGGPVYLFYSVNGSGHFCGMAQMISPVDYNSSVSVWAQDKWKGQFKVKWIYVKDVPNSQLRHIRLENNENKPVTNSRDTQEVPLEKGKQVLQIIHSFSHTTSIFDDFMHYEKRQEEESIQKKGDDVIVPPSGHSSHNRERESRQQNGAYSQENAGEGRGRYHNDNSRGIHSHDRPQLERDFRNDSRGGHNQGYNNGFQRDESNYFRGPAKFNQDFKGGFNQHRDPVGRNHRDYQNRDPRSFQVREDRPPHQRDFPQGRGDRRQLEPW